MADRPMNVYEIECELLRDFSHSQLLREIDPIKTPEDVEAAWSVSQAFTKLVMDLYLDGHEKHTADQLAKHEAAKATKMPQSLANARRLHAKIDALTKALSSVGYVVHDTEDGVDVIKNNSPNVGGSNETASDVPVDDTRRKNLRAKAERLAAARKR